MKKGFTVVELGVTLENMRLYIFTCVLKIMYSVAVYSQPACNISPTANCDPVGGGSLFLMSGSTAADFTFDSFGKYITGITVNGVTNLKMVVNEAAAPCRWQLHANIDNGGGATPITDWELLTPYGAAGVAPTVDLLQVRVRNECSTSLSGNAFVTIPNTGTSIDIVDSPGVSNAPGFCDGRNVNRPGSYLTDYGEYHYSVDFRIVPTLNLRPGVYQVTVRYCLTEDI